MRTVVLDIDPKSKANNKYRVAEDVQKVAARLITEIHSHLAEARIAYLFRDGTWLSKGKEIFGKAYKAPEQWQLIANYELLVVINSDVWNRMTLDQRKALIDHELCHFEKDEDEQGNPKWRLVAYDVEEFACVIRRHGLWSQEVRSFFESARQISLFDSLSESE